MLGVEVQDGSHFAFFQPMATRQIGVMAVFLCPAPFPFLKTAGMNAKPAQQTPLCKAIVASPVFHPVDWAAPKKSIQVKD